MLYAVNRDENGWQQTDAFKPERFIGKDGQCRRPDNLLPFGIGNMFYQLLLVIVLAVLVLPQAVIVLKKQIV